MYNILVLYVKKKHGPQYPSIYLEYKKLQLTAPKSLHAQKRWRRAKAKIWAQRRGALRKCGTTSCHFRANIWHKKTRRWEEVGGNTFYAFRHITFRLFMRQNAMAHGQKSGAATQKPCRDGLKDLTRWRRGQSQ